MPTITMKEDQAHEIEIWKKERSKATTQKRKTFCNGVILGLEYFAF